MEFKADSRQQMHTFIKGQGGRVRFDVFAQEHMMGNKSGFYSNRVDLRIGPNDVTTPSLVDPEYVQKISLLVAVNVLWLHAKDKQPGKIVFAEIGGGNGNFKKAFLEHWNTFVQDGLPFPLEYISIEPNPNHREAQRMEGGADVREGTAQKTGLGSRSVDVLFDDEVMDCLPVRLFRLDANKRITTEAFVRAEPTGLRIEFDSVEWDAHVEWYNRNLRQMGYRESESMCFSQELVKYWDESSRVLKMGGTRIGLDYHSGLFPLRIEEGCNALHRPYEVDLTHLVNFNLHALLAVQNGFWNREVGNLAKVMEDQMGPMMGGRFDAPIICMSRSVIIATKAHE